MSHLDFEITQLKEETLQMWNLVNSQIKKAKDALVNLDKDLAREVMLNEKRVNAYELKLDRDCENIFALFNPVAIDLRFVLAVLKINNNLERTADIAAGIAKFIISVEQNSIDKDLLNTTRVIEMFDESYNMMQKVETAFEEEDTSLARSVFKQDELLNEINNNANKVIANYIRKNEENLEPALYLLSTIRKLERAGDQAKNIAEEIIFFIEAKVLKHRSTKERSKK
jgi:phosphate transport system protein